MEFIEYAPRVWQWLRREVYGMSSEEYVNSMEIPQRGSDPRGESRKFSEAKGGGYFFFSTDRR